MPVTRIKLMEYLKKYSFEEDESVDGYRAQLFNTVVKIINDEVTNLESAILIKDRVSKNCNRLAKFLETNSEEIL
jgi:hypothetical protein